ncbi:L-glutamate gamma-semialdehyde dehydrogenase [Pasteuria penetrans]|uniref:L-glutamate gamma-semialdehyde dehydrogenase n=1 Tax=Pasteuria penetrans TaxID=86005 RepID=UPI000FC36D01|nr:L-glutamate gamma-semialdehyde dehydrogenase [Pasteuria penetrans]
MMPFRNEPFSPYNGSAIDRVRKILNREYDLILAERKVTTSQKITSYSPSHPEIIIGTVGAGDEGITEQAIQTAATSFNEWKRVSASARANILLRAASLLRRRRDEFSAWMVWEAGKTWTEADGDTAEAIDFLEFYARSMLELSQPHPLTPHPGERNELYYIPLGVGAIITPWNFPLAIMAGMTASAIVAGNTVVLKPASPTVVLTMQFLQLLQEAGLPAGVVNCVPGDGPVVGEYLVKHPDIRFISFTGSRDVGIRIQQLAAHTAPGQRWLKRVVSEMGGKDAIVVDKKADLDLAIHSIVGSAFHFAGQKCSACSRAIVHADVYDTVLQGVVEQTKKLKVGPSEDPTVHVGPVITPLAKEKILAYMEIGKKEGVLQIGGHAIEGGGNFLQPTVFSDVDPTARIAQEEIFGPVVAFHRASSFDHALTIANDTEYGLTGAVISNDRTHLEEAREVFHVGNLYFNRRCTGALVGVHPFGGFNMSGTDSKAGGKDYLLHFTQAKLVSEAF